MTTVNGYKPPVRAQDLATTVVVLVVLSPLLAAPLGLAWRVLQWAAGL